jgi:hypothetical protein
VNGESISFDTGVFPPGSPATIALQSQLPTITQGGIVVDASDAGVIVDGSAIPPDQVGLHIQSDGNHFMGLQWRNFPNDVLWVQAGGNTIGGDRSLGSGPLGQGNLFGNNVGTAVVINGSAAVSNTLAGNYIGVDLDGVTAAPNQEGVRLEWGASANLIGGDTPGEANVIAANHWNGIRLIGIGEIPAVDPLIDDVSLTFDGGANLLTNGSFNSDTLHWVVMDDNPAFGRSLNSGVYHSAPASYQFGRNGVFGAMRTFYDVQANTGSLPDPYHPASTIWITATPGTQVEFSFWYSGTIGAAFILGRDTGGGWRNLAIHGGYTSAGEWTFDALTTNIPADITAVGIQFDAYNLEQTARNIIRGNIIGANASGQNPLPNHEDGIRIENGTSETLVGGDSEAERNLIFSNGFAGVRLTSPTTSGNIIQGNFIGFGVGGIRQAYPRDMAISPDYASDCTLYVATQRNGIHKTSDCGQTWDEVNSGLSESRFIAIEIPPDATNANTAYAVAENGHLFVTTNGGAAWSLVSTTLEQFDRRNLAFSATFSADQTIYASARDWSWWEMGNEPGVFKSTNGGLTWARADSGMGNKNIWKVVASPEAASADTLFAITYNALYKSTDGGVTWMTLPAPDPNLTDIALSPHFSSDQMLFVAAWGDPNGRIYRSTDGGASWDGFDTPRSDPRHIAISPAYASDQTVCHGGGWNDWSYCSYDGGATWDQRFTALGGGFDTGPDGILFAPNYAVSHTIYLISPAGMSKSTDSGQSWQVLNGLHPIGNQHGVVIEDRAHHNTIGPANIIANNTQGVELRWDCADNLVDGNIIGAWPDGLAALPNINDGVQINGHHNTVTANLISGNLVEGVRINGDAAYENVVAGNLLGTDITGNNALGNGGAGLSLHSGAHHNRVGGDTPAERNIISGNGYAMGLWDWNTAYNTISGNYIGTNADGSAGLYAGTGIRLDRGAHDNLIGGDTPAEGNLISGTTWHGVEIRDGGTVSNTVSANIIGLDATGSYAIPNGGSGVWVENGPQHTVIGGDTPGRRNIISGNGLGEGWDRVGVFIGGQDTAFTILQGNYIGLDITGEHPVGNLGHGVELWVGTHDNAIRDNVISANGWEGILALNETPNNLIDGNYIGLNAAGTAALGNRRNGIYLGPGGWDNRSPRDNTIRNNVISGNGYSDNGYSGIVIDGDTASGNVIAENQIGTDPTGSIPLPNGLARAAGAEPLPRQAGRAAQPPINPSSLRRAADASEAAARQQQIVAGRGAAVAAAEGAPGANAQSGVTLIRGAHHNTVGPANIIAYNGAFGVEVSQAATNNTITQNSIFRNTRLGIGLIDGGNHHLPAPRITAFDLAAGTASGTACANCTIEIFSAADEEGQTYEGSATANAGGAWTFSAGHALGGPYLTATATNADGDTSPFAQRFTLLVYDLNVWQTFDALNRLGFQYDVVGGSDFASVDLSAYDVIFVGFTGNDPQPPDLLQPLLDRQADIAAFVQAGGALVANSEDGVVATPLDWLWVPVSVTHRNTGGNQQMLINLPDHLLVEGLTELELNGWWPYHNTFTDWDWPAAEAVLIEPGSGEAIILAGDYGAGRMIFSGSDPDYHGEDGAQQLLANEITWAAGVLADQPPYVAWHRPANDEATAAKTMLDAFFDQMIDPATLTDATFTVIGSHSGAIQGTLTYEPYYGVAHFVPADPFLVGETITVTVSGEVLDMTGNGLDGNGDQVSQGAPADDYTWTFTIRDPQTLLVNSTGDDGMWNYLEGQLTLRQAMETCQTGDTITFDPVVFPPAAPATIFIENGELPWMWPGYITIDAANAGVILDGSRLGGGNAFNIISDGNVIRGLQILYFPNTGINFEWRSQYNVIGGYNPDPATGCHGQCNLISGNGDRGIFLQGVGVRNNLITGNVIGADLSGNDDLGNGWRSGGEGIFISNGASHNQVGGDAPAERNLISGNAYGVVIDFASDNEVVGNYLGVNAAGTAALGNDVTGAGVGWGARNTFRNNLISGNQGVGLYLHWAAGDHNVVVGNRIGTDASGANPIPNNVGIELNYETQYNRIGGATPAERNIIAFNHDAGIAVYGGGSWANTFQQNSIYANGGQGIALWWFPALPQPVVTAANVAVGTASGTAPANCTIEIFSDADDEGRWYEGTTTSDGSGNWSFNKGSAFSGPNVHATATDADGNTSEFSGPGPVIDGLWPTKANPNTTNLAVWLWGSGYRENPPLGVDFGPGIDVTNIEFHHPGLLKVYLNIAADAAFGLRDVTVVINDGQTYALAEAFEIVSELPPPPVVTGVDPHQAVPGTNSEFYIYGSSFIDQPQVSVSGGDVWVNWVEFQSDTRLRVSLTVADDAPFGLRDVTVTNPTGQSFTLADALVIAPPIFEDVAPAFGLNLDLGEVGAAWGDWNDDGWLDLALGTGRLFTSNASASFSDDSAAAGLEPVPPYDGAAWGDYNNDGKLDLLTSRGKIYRQNSLPFTKIFDSDRHFPALSWADYDLDGDLDAYASSRLYRNDGGDIFSDVTVAVGLTEGDWIMSSSWADYDQDGYPDLYLAAGGMGGQAYLYHNDGGTFTDVTESAGMNLYNSGHGSAWGDYDNDGDLDLFVASNDNQFSLLFRNNGDGTFSEVGEAAGLRDRPGNATGANWLDYDLDGWLDLFVVNRDVPSKMYRNHGDGTFSDYGAAVGVAYSQDSDGSSVGDYDNDGDPDIFVVSGLWDWRETPSLLLQNNLDHANRHWLKVRLEGILSNYTGIGARVVVYTDGPLQTRLIAGSTGYMSQDAPEALFGLGSYTGTVGVIVYWPSGVVDVKNFAVDQTVVIAESTPYFHDLGLTSVLPAGERPIDVAFQPLVTLRNYGQNSESGAPVTCRITRNAVEIYAETLTTGMVTPANWASLAFPAFTPTQTGVYQLTCQAALPGDENAANNQIIQTITVTEQVADVWSKDDPNDDGNVPSSLNNWYMSPDLWVRNNPDGGLIPQDPIQGITNTVYVRLRNRGNTAVATGDVSVYWIEPSLSVRCGGWAPIGVITFTNLLPGEVRILSLPWVPTRSGHTCLQDVIDSPQDPYAAALECTPQWVPWDNNVSWHNVNILANAVVAGRTADGLSPVDIKESAVQLVNIYELPKDVDVIVDRMTFPANGDILVRLPSGLFERWLSYGAAWGEGIEVLTETQEIRITGAVSATIGSIPMMANEEVTVGLQFSGPAGLTFEMGIRERIDGITMGGVSYQWVIPDTTPPTVVSVSPTNGQTGVLWDAPIVITFSEPVGPLSLNVLALPNPGAWLYDWNADSTVVTITHAPFAPGSTYQFSFTVNDASGNALATPFQWSFTTLQEAHFIFLPVIFR